MVQNLTQAVPLLSNNEERARISYIIGQVYQKLEFDAQAYSSYRTCLKSNPNFDLSFYAKLNIAQVTELSNSSDLKQVRKYFKKLLKDRKNEEFKDKIYYEMANFELKQKNTEDAIDNYNKSLRISNNQRQKGYSYLKLGEIYYSNYKDYELAKSYYDSVVSVFPKDEPQYEEIAERQQILANFVTQLNTIKDQDSLINLSKMDTAALGAYVDEYIALKQRELEENEKNKKKKSNSGGSRQSTAFNYATNQINTNLAGSTWYFYNTSVVSQGRSEFRRIWGNRILEDNWRRSTKDQTISEIAPEKINSEQTKSKSAETPGSGSLSFNRQAMMAAVPYSEEAQKESLKKIEEAYFKLGNIYDFDLEEKLNAITTFETMLSRFPETEYKPEVMYQLYLLYKGQGNDRQNHYRNALITEFPKSIFAKIIINPNYRAESQAATVKLQKIYKKAYELQEKGEYGVSSELIRNALREYPENDFSDNLKLLEIINIGHTEDVYKYQYELNNFISNYSESDLLPYAQNLVKASEDFQINLFNSSRAIFIKYFDQTHFFVLVYNADKKLSEELPGKIQRFYKKSYPLTRLTTANLILDAEHSIVMVNEFDSKQQAMEFYSSFKNSDVLDEYSLGNFSSFTITKDNFKIFYETKELDSYVTFFEENYQR
jgi:outer membrane protein assembly factor BamD (BamD/ComL family)